MEIMMRFMIIYIEAVFGAQVGLIARLRAKGRTYWAIAAAVLVGGLYFQHYLYDALHLAGARAELFATLFNLDPRPLLPRHVKVLLIGDEEYWKSQKLAGRRPINRDYLAQLVDTLADPHADIHVIALDFDMRLPDPEARAVADYYLGETRNFIKAVVTAANANKIVVLGKTVGLDAQRRYMLDPDVYQLFGLCKPAGPGEWDNQGTDEYRVTRPNNIRCGFLELPYDPLVIPE